MTAFFEPDYAGIREYLRLDPELAAALYAKGEEVLEQAKSIAPVGDLQRNRNKKEHPGTYRNSLKIGFSVGPTRMAVQVYSDDPKAFWIEYGSAHMPKYAVLRRALDSVNGAGIVSGEDYAGIEEYFAANPKAAIEKAKRERRKANRAKG